MLFYYLFHNYITAGLYFSNVQQIFLNINWFNKTWLHLVIVTTISRIFSVPSFDSCRASRILRPSTVMAATIFFFCLIAASCIRIAAQEQALNQFPCTTYFIRYPNRALLSSKISTVEAANVASVFSTVQRKNSANPSISPSRVKLLQRLANAN